MTDTPIVKIDSLEDLKKVLFLQRTLTRKASDELEAIASDSLIDTEPSPARVKKFMMDEAELLATYARRPTLSEWGSQGGINRSGIYAEASTWGATFGVTTFVGELILEQVCQSHKDIPLPTMKGVLMVLLSSVAESNGGVIDPRAVRFNVEGNRGEVANKIQDSITGAAKTILAIGAEYGLFAGKDDETYIVTEIGTRVLIHMQDVIFFVDAVTQAHKRFQGMAPRIPSTKSK